MKLTLAPRPIAVWKEPRLFIQQERPTPIFHGWVQFRIFVYVTIGGIGYWLLFKLNPQTSVHALGFIPGLGLALLFAASLVYAMPYFVYLSPSIARLYSNRLTLCRGGFYMHECRFGILSKYRLERGFDGWVLRLFGFNEKEDQIAIALPDDDIKIKVETALSASGVPNNEILCAANVPNEIIEAFLIKIEAYRSAIRRSLRTLLTCYLIFIGVTAILIPSALYLNALGRYLVFIGWAIIYAILIAGVGIAEPQFKKRLARDFGLNCSHCGKLAVGSVSMQALVRNQTCAYCGKTFLRTC